MIQLTWLPTRTVYSVRRNGRLSGLVRFGWPIPLRQIIQLPEPTAAGVSRRSS